MTSHLQACSRHCCSHYYKINQVCIYTIIERHHYLQVLNIIISKHAMLYSAYMTLNRLQGTDTYIILYYIGIPISVL